MGSFHEVRGYHKVCHAVAYDALLIDIIVSAEMIL
jgi:hypothetical protein